MRPDRTRCASSSCKPSAARSCRRTPRSMLSSGPALTQFTATRVSRFSSSPGCQRPSRSQSAMPSLGRTSHSAALRALARIPAVDSPGGNYGRCAYVRLFLSLARAGPSTTPCECTPINQTRPYSTPIESSPNHHHPWSVSTVGKVSGFTNDTSRSEAPPPQGFPGSRPGQVDLGGSKLTSASAWLVIVTNMDRI